MRWMAPCGLVGLLAILSACSPSVGTACNEALARTVVYDPGGSPAYEGQAMMITSCAGGGSFCHSSSASRRYGAPHGMNFDPVLADSTRFPDPATGETGAQHLYAAQYLSDHLRDDIFWQVSSGLMPPGAAGQQVMPLPYRSYTGPGDTIGMPVPDVRSADGREILRNWLACGSPVVEATSYPPIPTPCSSDADCTLTHHCGMVEGVCDGVGAIVPARQATTPNWSSIHSTILMPTCALPVCHAGAGAAISAHLDLSSAASAYTALVNTMSDTTGCGTRVIPSDPENSLLVQKLEGRQQMPRCGDRMPIGSTLMPDQIAIIRMWIANGAMND